MFHEPLSPKAGQAVRARVGEGAGEELVACPSALRSLHRVIFSGVSADFSPSSASLLQPTGPQSQSGFLGGSARGWSSASVSWLMALASARVYIPRRQLPFLQPF